MQKVAEAYLCGEFYNYYIIFFVEYCLEGANLLLLAYKNFHSLNLFCLILQMYILGECVIQNCLLTNELEITPMGNFENNISYSLWGML